MSNVKQILKKKDAARRGAYIARHAINGIEVHRNLGRAWSFPIRLITLRIITAIRIILVLIIEVLTIMQMKRFSAIITDNNALIETFPPASTTGRYIQHKASHCDPHRE